jgi:polyphosphate glucokinase
MFHLARRSKEEKRMARAPKQTSSRRKAAPAAIATLALDVGGTGLKAAVLDEAGAMLTERARIDTPHPAPPKVMVDALVTLAKSLPVPFDRISIGFPGVVRDGRVLTAPHFGNDVWHGFPLAETLARRLRRPVRLLNDADVQGYGAISGKGLEFVITLGTGVGSALFRNGELMPHMEFAQFPFRGKHRMNDYVGEAVREKISPEKWKKRVRHLIEDFATLINYDTLYIGGGNARHIDFALPNNVRVVSNDDGLTGGIRLWDDDGAKPRPGSKDGATTRPNAHAARRPPLVGSA